MNNINRLIIATIFVQSLAIVFLIQWGMKRVDSEEVEENYIKRDIVANEYVERNDYRYVVDCNTYKLNEMLSYGYPVNWHAELLEEYKKYDVHLVRVADCILLECNVNKWQKHNNAVLERLKAITNNENIGEIIGDNAYKNYKIKAQQGVAPEPVMHQ